MKKNSRDNRRSKNNRKRSIKQNASEKNIHEFVHFKATGNKDGFVKISLGKNGEVACSEAEAGTINSYKGYMRESGKEKRVVRSYTRQGTAFVNQRDNIVTNYDALAGIDTNDYVFEEKKLSIVSSFFSSAIKSDTVEFKILPAFVIESVRDELNSELVGWYLFFKHTLPLLNLDPAKILGLVVDTELGMHVEFNVKQRSYYAGQFLPSNVGLIYASSDTGSDLPNKLIKACDNSSRQLFRKIEGSELILPSQLSSGTSDYSGYVYVNYDTSEFLIAG